MQNDNSTVELNDGQGNFSYLDPYLREIKTTGNINSDDNPDLVGPGGIYINNGDATFELNEQLNGNLLLDLDNDGDDDILKKGQFEGEFWSYYENLGDGEFSEERSTPFSSTEVLYFFDVDADGVKDAIALGDNLGWHKNLDGKFSFSEKTAIDDIAAVVVREYDVDNDQDLDLVAGGDGFIVWYENLSINFAETPLKLSLSSQQAYSNQEIAVPVKVTGFDDLNALAFSLSWDAEVATLESVSNLNAENATIDLSQKDAGQLGFDWTSDSGQTLSDNATLLTLNFTLSGAENTTTTVAFSDDPQVRKASNASTQTVKIESTATGTLSILVNEAPNDINLSKNTIEENQAVGSLIGNIFTKDEDDSEGFTYTFVEGEGDTDNAAFQIDNTNQLLSAEVFDFETKNSYSIRIETTDSKGKSLQKAFQISVSDVDESTNQTPTAIALSNLSVDENEETGTLVGTLSTTDEDENDEHTYTLVEGQGSTGNDFFAIKNNQLLTFKKFDFEAQPSYNIRIQTDDGNGGKFSNTFVIAINDLEEASNEVPTDLALSNQRIQENEAGGMTVGELSTTDPDAGDSHSYALVGGEGSEGNDFFTIKNNRLISLASFDYEQQSQTTVRIETDDNKGGTFQKSFTIFIEDVADAANEVPTDISLSNASVNENEDINTLVGVLSATDADDTDFAFSLVIGAGNTDNASFKIEGNQLLTAESFDYELKDRYTIRIRADDGKGGAYAKQFRIDINDVEDALNNSPTAISLSNQSIEENQEIGTAVGNFTSTDKDEDDVHTYYLIEAEDHAFFTIVNRQLLTDRVFDFETRSTFVIKVQTDDGRGGMFIQAFVINVTDVNEVKENTAPVVSNFISDQSLVVGEAFTFTIPANAFSDQDEEDQLTYTATSGNGDPLPEWLTFDAEAMTLSGMPEVNGTVTIRVTATDQQGATASDEFILSIEGVTATDEALSKLYKIYPNPAESYLRIEMQNPALEITHCLIIDHKGRLVKKWEVNTRVDLQVDMHSLKTGAYILELVSADKTLRMQILKK
ncbi:cadherin domain-containing protein [Catalinimonas niigatensis]|uniref:cadherin domain-containing protein n=1 Tax=Catalinimonas niigatensis TaxID=1397264 RepID=UPI002665DAA8|nr:cadherin domain-containing protein [Catalinimonas niigatensis]WPP52739.1 cadherin domain-containing protein [Catalinimonas niigatensis]